MFKYRGIFHRAVSADDYVTVTEAGREYDIPVLSGPVVAFEGDTVEVFTQGEIARIFAPGSAYKQKCRVCDVVRRACDVVTGEYVVADRTAYLVPDSYIPYRVKIKGSAGSPECAPGDKIKAEILKYRTFSAMRAKPVANFGRADTFRANLNAALHGTPYFAPFSAAAEKQASAARPYEAVNYISRRRDLRGKTVFTFSETETGRSSYAFSVSFSENEWVLGLHAADVAEYLAPGTPLDNEAAKRGKALFPGRDGSPLFPEQFRRSVCDLGIERPVLAVSAFVTFDIHGNVLDTDLCESVIDPVLTASASDVDALVSGADSSALLPLRRKYSAVTPSFEQLYELAAVLRAKRLAGGGVDFDLCDRVFAFDSEKRVSGVSLVPRSDSALMAAELLAAVGEACAEKLRYSGAGCVYSSLGERVYNAATGVPNDRYLLGPEEYFTPGYTAREAAKARGTFAEHYCFAYLTDETDDAFLSPVPAPHYMLNAQKYIRFYAPAKRYSDLVNQRAIKAFIREEPFDVRRYERAINAEMSAYALKRRLTGLFECAYAAKNRDTELKATVLNICTGGAALLLENGVCAFMPAAEGKSVRPGEKLKVKVKNIDYRLGRFTLE